jgi:hypothetical protein
MAAPSPCVAGRLLVNVNAFTNPPTREDPITNGTDAILSEEEDSGSHGGRSAAVPIAMKRLANLGGGYNPFREVFFDSLVSTQSQPYF